MPLPYEKLPVSVRDEARWYIEDHKYPGNFLAAIFSNNLFRSWELADRSLNQERDLCNIVAWIYNHAPSGCHGSEKIFKSWHKRAIA